MRMVTPITLVLALAPTLALAASCEATSGEQRTPVVELFTSEGCSSCPPADRWLSSLRRSGSAPARITALAYHVDYWDYIGWKDRFADSAHGERHRRMVARAGGHTRYTPQVFVNGIEYRAWRSGIEPPADDSSAASLTATTQPNGFGRLSVAVSGATKADGPLTLSIALAENAIESSVTAGENDGEHLRHDFVVRKLKEHRVTGPEFEVTDTLDLPADAVATNVHTSLVLRGARGELLQSVSVGPCT